MFVPNFKSLGQAVPEKTLAEIKLTDRQTDRHPYRKSKNYIPPIYFVYRGYNEAVTYLISFQPIQVLYKLLPSFTQLSLFKSQTETEIDQQTQSRVKCLVFYPIMVEGYAALFSCKAVVQASDSMTASM